MIFSKSGRTPKSKGKEASEKNAPTGPVILYWSRLGADIPTFYTESLPPGGGGTGGDHHVIDQKGNGVTPLLGSGESTSVEPPDIVRDDALNLARDAARAVEAGDREVQ